MRKPLRVFSYAAFSIGTLLVIGVAANNLSLARPAAAECNSRLDRALRDSIDWESALPVESNAYLIYMIRDSAALTGDPKLQSLFNRSANVVRGTYLDRFADPNAEFHQPPPSLNGLAAYERWIAHAISRGEYSLSAQEHKEMFEPDGTRTGRATHQLFSLVLYRQFNGTTPALDQLIRHISLRIAQEAAIDFRVTDLYLQRIAFLLAAGQQDLVKPRWVERALAAQESNGGWMYGWYGWHPTPYRLSVDEFPDSHATAQGMWLAAMLKHRYPEWIRANYPN